MQDDVDIDYQVLQARKEVARLERRITTLEELVENKKNIITGLRFWLEKQIRVQNTMKQIESGNKRRVLFYNHRKEAYTCCLNKLIELEKIEK